MSGNIIRLPDDFEEIELGMSNYDGQIDEGFGEALKNKKTFGRHSAIDFNGLVYWLNGKFNTDVWVYGSYRETFSEDTLEKLMASVNAEYGLAYLLKKLFSNDFGVDVMADVTYGTKCKITFKIETLNKPQKLDYKIKKY